MPRVTLVRALVLAAAALVSLATVGVAAAETPPSLLGEQLVWVPSADDRFTASCNPLGTSTITWRASGVAVGPYPGTFTASGTSSFGPVSGLPVDFSESFTIESPLATIHGQKSGELGVSASTTCDPLLLGNVALLSPGALYAAIIVPADGGPSYQDSGFATTFVGGIPSGTLLDYQESFNVSDGVVPFLPVTKEQCKDGAFFDFGGLFPNQGACVSYVVHQ